MWILGLKWLRYTRALSICDTVKLPISNHPKCKDLVVAYRRWSFTRIIHRGLVQEKVQHIYFFTEYLLHANKVTYICSCLYTLSGVPHTANKETIPCVK